MSPSVINNTNTAVLAEPIERLKYTPGQFVKCCKKLKNNASSNGSLTSIACNVVVNHVSYH